MASDDPYGLTDLVATCPECGRDVPLVERGGQLYLPRHLAFEPTDEQLARWEAGEEPPPACQEDDHEVDLPVGLPDGLPTDGG